MKYKIRNKDYGYEDILHEFLASRGIEDPIKYSNLTDEDLHEDHELKNMTEATVCLVQHIQKNSNIAIIVDSDMDGFCSSAIMHRFITSLDGFKGRLDYLLHTGKQHGFDGLHFPQDTNLIISPDGGSNDIRLCKHYSEKGVDIIVLDHHEIEEENPYAIIVNPKNCDYPNKELSGGAVTYKFIQSMNYFGHGEVADSYLDLAGFSIISDSMDIRSPESRRIVEKGFDNLKSEMLLAFLNKQSYSIKDIFNPTIVDVQFYIAPLVNGMVRSGSQEDKELMFRGFAEIYEEFDYTKRDKSIVKENVYDRVARLCSNAKAKQNRSIDKEIKEIDKTIVEKKLSENKILVVNGTRVKNKNFSGLIAMKLASKYNMPCLILSKWGASDYGGSARNVFGCEVESLKDLLNDTGFFKWAKGHGNAFGVKIGKDKIKPMIKFVNNKLKDVTFDPLYKIDFVFNEDEIDYALVDRINEISKYQGQGIEESLSLVKEIEFELDDIELLGAKKDTWKVELENGVGFIKFKCKDDDEILKLKSDEWGGGKVVLSMIVSFSMSAFNGVLSPQGIVKDYEVVGE